MRINPWRTRGRSAQSGRSLLEGADNAGSDQKAIATVLTIFPASRRTDYSSSLPPCRIEWLSHILNIPIARYLAAKGAALFQPKTPIRQSTAGCKSAQYRGTLPSRSVAAAVRQRGAGRHNRGPSYPRGPLRATDGDCLPPGNRVRYLITVDDRNGISRMFCVDKRA
jgi:hypothetical protein